MDPETLRASVEHAGLAAVAIGFVAGLGFSFNPVALAAIPVSLAYVTKARSTRTAIVFGAMFIAGMLVTHVLLGLAAAFGGESVQRLIGREWGLVLGPLLIALGFVWAGWIRLPIPALKFSANRATNVWGAFMLGVPFSVAVCPVCTPALVVMLGTVAALGAPVFGATLLLAFAIGRAIPVALGAGLVGWLGERGGLGVGQRVFEIAGGVVLILSGLYMLNAYLILIPALAA